MKIYLPEKASTYVIDYQGVTFTLTLVTSVAFYKAKIFPQYLKWKVVDDSDFLKKLIQEAQNNPSKQTLEPLIEMENLYKEMVNGKAQEGSSSDQQKEARSNKDAAERDLYSKNNRTDAFFRAETSDILDASLSTQPTLGDLHSENKAKNGKNRFAWRTKKIKKET